LNTPKQRDILISTKPRQKQLNNLLKSQQQYQKKEQYKMFTALVRATSHARARSSSSQIASNEIKDMTSGASTAAFCKLMPQLEELTKKKNVTAGTSIGTGEMSIPN
jgi:hypothetical protein